MTPRQFLAVYECEECGDEYEMHNCYLPFVTIPCDDCGTLRRFYAQRLIHQSWEWDIVED